MAKIVTENFRIEATNDFIDSFNSNEGNHYYMMASTVAQEDEIQNTQLSKREFQRKVIFGNKITSDNVRHMFPIRSWQEDVVYDAYDDTKDMSNSNFYVTVLTGQINQANYNVFKCIRNNNNAQSKSKPVPPSSDDNEFEITMDDGYVWKYMFDVTPSDYILYGTSRFLPWTRNLTVEQQSKDGLSDIIVESGGVGLFSDYLFGDLTSPTRATLSTVTQGQALVDGITEQAYTLDVIASTAVKTTVDSYVNMYLLIDGALYDITSSNQTPNANISQMTVVTDTNLKQYEGQDCYVVPKIIISEPNNPTGIQAQAYGIVNNQGDLVSVAFKTKGSGYHSVQTSIAKPKALQDDPTALATVVRGITSPKGGHASNSPMELFMSRCVAVTSFYSDVNNNIPSVNNYTKVGLIKNPEFETINTGNGTVGSLTVDEQYKIISVGDSNSLADWQSVAGAAYTSFVPGTIFTAITTGLGLSNAVLEPLPVTFDNRVKISLNVRNTAINVGDILTQLVDDQTVTGVVHEVKYPSATETEYYIVNSDGNYNKQFQAPTAQNPVANIVGKTSVDSAFSSTITSTTINSIEQKKYTTYSGDLLHFVDFEPITRQEDTKEKVKLIFDF